MHAVALVVMDLRDRRVDWDFVEVRAAKPRNLRIGRGVNAATCKKLRDANQPPAGILLDELCQNLGVTGLEMDMATLRNKLTHRASDGDFTFPQVVDLHSKLSHVVDVCKLNILGYDGYYCHRATNWRCTRLGVKPKAEPNENEAQAIAQLLPAPSSLP